MAGQSRFGSWLDVDEAAMFDGSEVCRVGADDLRFVETVGEAVGAFEDYVDAKEDAVTVLEDTETGDVAVMPYAHRWTPEYRDRTRGRFDRAERHLRGVFGYPRDGDEPAEVPVTWLAVEPRRVAPDGDPRPHGEVLSEMLAEWDDLRATLYHESDGRTVEYLRWFEPTEWGYPRLRIAVFGLFADGMIGGYSARREVATVGDALGRIRSAFGRILVSDGGLWEWVGHRAFAALFWVTGKRQYSTSQGLSAAMRDSGSAEPSGSWRFVGVGYGIEPGHYSGDRAVQIRQHVESAAYKPPPATGPRNAALPP